MNGTRPATFGGPLATSVAFWSGLDPSTIPVAVTDLSRARVDGSNQSVADRGTTTMLLAEWCRRYGGVLRDDGGFQFNVSPHARG